MQPVTAERHTVRRNWRDTPSQHYDWDAAIQRLYRVFDEVYGPRWRKGLK